MADYNINAITRRVVFTGSAGLGPYAFSFEILANTDIVVYFNATKLTLTTDFTVTINANGTGSVTLIVNVGGNIPATPTASDQVVVIGARDIERVTDFVTAGDLLASSLNEQLDSLTIFDQQVAEENARAIRAPAFDPALVEDGGVVDMTLPTKDSRAGKTLAFDTNGNPVAGEDIGNWRGNWAAGVAFNVRDLVKDASNSNVYRVNTAHTSSGTTPISSNADVAKFDLVVDASAADASATAAAASATAAAADAVSTAADVVSTNADVVLTNADVVTTGNNVTAAQAAQAAAEAAADDFTDRYYGAHADDSAAQTYITGQGLTVDTGDLYFNTAANITRVYNGSSWDNVATSTAGFLTSANNLSDLSDADAALTNLGLTATAAEINYNDITTLGLVEASKTVTADANAEITIPDDKKLYFGTDQDAHIRFDEATTDTLIVDGAKVKFGKAVRGNNFSSNATGSTTLSFETYQNFILTLTGAVTLANPTTETTGQTGFIIFIQDGTGNRVVSLGTDYETAGGSGLTLSTAASATDIVPYVVAANGRILLGTPQLAFA